MRHPSSWGRRWLWRRAEHLGLRAACCRFRSWQLAAGITQVAFLCSSMVDQSLMRNAAPPVSPQQAAGEKAAASRTQSKVLRTPPHRAPGMQLEPCTTANGMPTPEAACSDSLPSPSAQGCLSRMPSAQVRTRATRVASSAALAFSSSSRPCSSSFRVGRWMTLPALACTVA